MASRASFTHSIRSVSLTPSEGEKINLTAVFAECDIYEDMFSNTLSGELLITDGYGALDVTKVKGGEKLTIEVHQDNATVKVYDFYVYSVSNRKRIASSSEMYSLKFTSVETIINENLRVSKAFKGTNAGMAKAIFNFTGSQKTSYFEETIGKTKVVTPLLWTPFEAINWLCGRSKSAESGGSYYLFYERMDGFRMACVETLAQAEPIREFRYEPTGANAVFKDTSNIKEFEIMKLGDDLEGIKQKYTTLWSHDMITKKVVKETFNYGTDSKGKLNNTLFGDLNLHAFGLNFEGYRGLFGSQPVLSYETLKTHDETQDYTYKTIQPKLAAMRQFSNVRVKFLVMGDADLHVGDAIDLKLNKAMFLDEKNKDQAEDKMLSGKYLTSAIRYIFKPSEFNMVVEAIKDTRKD